MANGSAEVPKNIYVSLEIINDQRRPEWFRAMVGEFILKKTVLDELTNSEDLSGVILDVEVGGEQRVELQSLTSS